MSVEELSEYLTAKGIKFQILQFEEHTMTVEAAEKRLGVSRKKIIKSMAFVDEKGELVLAIVGGDKRVSEIKLAEACGARKVKKAHPAFAKAVTGYEVGAMPPVGHRKPIRTFIDREVLVHDKVYGGGGSVRALLEISPRDIQALTGGRVADISE